MRSTTIVSTLMSGAVALNVVKFDIYGVRDSASRLSRRDTIDGPLDNLKNQYNINLTIGTPPQSFSLQLDTGSSDLWVNTAESAFCSAANSTCTGGLFDSSASSTYQESQPGGFRIGYFDNTSASGDYGLDTVVVGGATILNQTIGVVNVTDIPAGLIGVAFPDNEAVCHGYSACPAAYPTIVDSMVSQGKINTRAYSLWLDNLNASTGSILFGGIDTSKYQGDLVALEIIPDFSNATFKLYKNFNVLWANLTVTGVDNFWDETGSHEATLDSGTALTYVPPAAYKVIATNFNVSSDLTVDCSYRGADVTFDFTFGSSDGPIISVDIAELILDNGDGTCYFGLGPCTEEPCLVGDTFLRSAYVVYDLENKEIGIAQTDFSGGEPNVIEIGAASIPNVSSTAVATSVPAPATSGYSGAPIGPVTATGTVTSPPSTYTGAGVAVRAGSNYVLGCVVAVLTVFMAI